MEQGRVQGLPLAKVRTEFHNSVDRAQRLTYQGKLPPYPHQLEALERLRGRRVFALYMFMRTGKTKVVLDNFGQLEEADQVDDMLVIAPAGVYHTWETAIADHVEDPLLQRLAIFTWTSGSANTKRALAARKNFLEMNNGQPRIALMNVEALSTVDKAKAFCKQFLRDRSRAMIVIDESCVIKSRKAQRTKFINHELAPRASYRRILSGLPTPHSPLDLWSQFEFLDPAILQCKNYWIFQARYAIMRRVHYGRWVDEIVGYQNLDQLQKLIEPYSFRVQFRPKIPSTFTIREVALTSEQKRIYAEMKKFATAKLEETSHVTATVVIAQLLRLHQILCGYTLDEKGAIHEIPEARTSELLEILDDYSGKAVIWCSYDYSVRKVAAAIAKEYGPASIARFWGGNVSTRENEEREFRTNPECRFMVATPAAGGRGRTWLEADLVIYFSSTNNLEHRDQSEQRVQGMTKERQVDYIDLIAPGTMEPKILDALRKKIDLAAIITGDEWRQWVV
jgi:SNF2 family DNA or RNA helicase